MGRYVLRRGTELQTTVSDVWELGGRQAAGLCLLPSIWHMESGQKSCPLFYKLTRANQAATEQLSWRFATCQET